LGGEPRKKDDVWALTRYAQRQKAGGFERAYRREATWTSGRPSKGSLVNDLPARAVCSRCGFINVLRADRLKAQPHLRQGPAYTSTGIKLPPPFVLVDRKEGVDKDEQPP